MTNRQLTERIIGDLNELVDKRGNTKLIPQLVAMRSFLDDIEDLERMVAALNAAGDDG